MEASKLKKFIEFMNENNLAELEIEEEGKRIRLKKNVCSEQITTPKPSVNIPDHTSELKTDNLAEITSPMVGTFYRAPSPEANPYKNVGENVNPGDVLCIIEAMKLMNEIKSEISGKIIQVSVENGEPVEFGQTLFRIDPL